MLIKVVSQPVCPICHSDMTKGYKVHDGKEWWSRCISGLDHGVYVTPDGKEHNWPKSIYFTDSGKIEVPGGYVTIER